MFSVKLPHEYPEMFLFTYRAQTIILTVVDREIAYNFLQFIWNGNSENLRWTLHKYVCPFPPTFAIYNFIGLHVFCSL